MLQYIAAPKVEICKVCKRSEGVWKYYKLTINVPLFKKMRDIIFFLRDNNFLSRFEGYFEGAKTFLTP